MADFKQGGRINNEGGRRTIIATTEKTLLVLFDGVKKPEEVKKKRCKGQRGRTSTETAERAAKFIKIYSKNVKAGTDNGRTHGRKSR